MTEICINVFKSFKFLDISRSTKLCVKDNQNEDNFGLIYWKQSTRLCCLVYVYPTDFVFCILMVYTKHIFRFSANLIFFAALSLIN